MEGRCLSADAHLALLGVNYSGNGILGLRKIKKQREIAASFHGAPSGRMFQRVKVPNPPDSGKDIAKSKGVLGNWESEGSWR